MPRDLIQIAQRYASQNRLAIRESLGSGIHGHVLLVQGARIAGAAALKVYHADEFFQRELAVYRRLNELRTRQILGFAVPQFIRADGELLGLEMTVVKRPYVLDFAGAYLDDEAPTFTDEVWTMWEADKVEKFGAYWPEVKAVLAALENHGITMLDVNPGNIAFTQ